MKDFALLRRIALIAALALPMGALYGQQPPPAQTAQPALAKPAPAETGPAGPARAQVVAPAAEPIVAQPKAPDDAAPPAPDAAPAAAPAAPVLFVNEALPGGAIQLVPGDDAAELGPFTYARGKDLPRTVQVSSAGVLTGSFGKTAAGIHSFSVRLTDTKTQKIYTAIFQVDIEDSITGALTAGNHTVTVLAGANANIAATLPDGATVSAATDGTPYGFSVSLAKGVLTLKSNAAKTNAAAGANGNFAVSVSFKDAAGAAQTATLNVTIANSAQIALGDLALAGAQTSTYDDLCSHRFNDCDWMYSVTGGAEESALSAQDSQTNPFISLFVRAPWNIRFGSGWLQARFLGAANANNTNNVVAAYQSATGTTSTSGLPQVGTALDYIFGFEHDFFQPTAKNPARGMFTLGIIGAFGATTPLSAQHATTAYIVPAYGSNECTQLLLRFPSTGVPSGLPAEPSTYPNITTTVVTAPTPTGGNPAPTSTGPYCIINGGPNGMGIATTTSSGSATTVTTVSGIQIQDIAFAPEDRNSFLLKYMGGVRLINRWLTDSSKDGCGTDTQNKKVPCTRSVVDFTLGQDESITGGSLRHFVFKAEAIFPIPNTTVYFFGSSALRLEGNKYYSPLILQPATIVPTGAAPPATITVPSANTWILPLTQPDRDFYRIGLGIDLGAALAKAFGGK